MMTSFIAAIEDGIAYGSDVKHAEIGQKGTEKAAESGFSIPILSSLFNLDLRGKITGNEESGSSQEVTMVRRHTEASLFMRLRQTMKDQGLIVRIDSANDIEEINAVVHSPIVEISGYIQRSPLSETLEAVFRMLNMLGIDVPDEGSVQAQKQQAQVQRKGGQGKKSQPVTEQENFELDAESLLGLQIAKRVKRDLEESKILDVVLQSSNTANLSAVLSLGIEALPEGALDNLLNGQFTVLGKVTRVVQGEEEISLYQRSALQYFVSNSELEAAFTSIGKETGIGLSSNRSSIPAPALQIMPLAIYS